MGENLFCPGLSRVSEAYKDGHMRSFRGYPEMSQDVMGMVEGWIQEEKYTSAILFFTEKCEFDAEYSGFLVREFIRGNIKTEAKGNGKETSRINKKRKTKGRGKEARATGTDNH